MYVAHRISIEGWRNMNRILVTVLAASVCVLSSCSGSSSVNATREPLPAVPADYAGKTNPFGAEAAGAGGVLFEANCASCHGDAGRGDGPAAQALYPKPVNLVELGQLVADDFLYWRISTGVPGTPMIAWKGVLADEQIWEIIAFIRTLK
jgi:mono/diheme cytochrome c family protein